MNPRIDASIDRIADRARGQYESFIHGARSQTEQAAGRVRNGKKPVQTLSRLGLELTSISHRATADIVKSQARMVENQMDALAGRLHNAAQADSLRGLVRDQIRLIPASAAQFVEDTRSTFSVVREAGGEVRNLVAGTVAEFRKPVAKPAAKPAKKKAAPKKAASKKAAKKKVAKKAAKKTASKKPAAAKAAPAPKQAEGTAKQA